MFGKKAATQQIDTAVTKAANFEITIADMARRSERRAWMVAWSAIAMALILAGGYFYFLPLKEKVPYLVMADAYTGTSSVARLTGDFGDQGISASEALNKSNISHFVLARESYDYSQFGQRDWNTVHAMGAPGVTVGYTRLYAKTNPGNPQTLFGKNRSVRVKILSVQLHDAIDTGSRPKAATVRFQRSLFDKGAGTAEPLDSKIASIEYVYKSNLKMDERNRTLNPLGFQVTSYRVDNDYAASPPIEDDIPAPVSAPPAPVDPSALGANAPVSPAASAADGTQTQQLPAAQSAGTAASSNANGVSNQ
ncbi:type IV secretion system protein [Lysobacter terrestris]|uniref:Type IV secretion system protein n=2 Tax=Agrilutibacter terrestris TaxID=2865112 RepID=A0A7H0G163_9GAMM|nr:type IV secretion system protein [Lysobacter terrestris]